MGAGASFDFGGAKLAIGGESAGAHLAALTPCACATRGANPFHAANPVFGVFDAGMTPSARAFGNDERLVLRTIDIEKFSEAFLPGLSWAENAGRIFPRLPIYAGFAPPFSPSAPRMRCWTTACL